MEIIKRILVGRINLQRTYRDTGHLVIEIKKNFQLRIELRRPLVLYVRHCDNYVPYVTFENLT